MGDEKELDSDAELEAELDRVLNAGTDKAPEADASKDLDIYRQIREKRVDAKDEQPKDEKKPEGKKNTPEKKLERATTALKRSGLEDDEIAELRKKLGDDKFSERGLKQEEIWSKQDAAWRELQDLKKTKEPADKAAESGSGEDGAVSDKPAPSKARTALEASWGKELATSVDELIREAVAPFQSKIEELGKLVELNEVERGDQIIDGIREKLGKRFPGLMDAAQFEPVKERMRALGSLDSLRDDAETATELVERLMIEAARAAGLEERDVRLRSLKDQGTADEPTERSTPAPRTQTERDRAAYAWIKRHPRDVEGARRAANGR